MHLTLKKEATRPPGANSLQPKIAWSWLISLIRSKAQFLGYVDAPSSEWPKPPQ
jgi:hypothetical protein